MTLPGGRTGPRVLAMLALVAVLATTATAIVPSRPSIATIRANPSLRVRAQIRGLYPGRSAYLWVRVRNTGDGPVVLTLVRTRVRDASQECAASNLRVHRFRGGRWIPAHGLVRVRVRVRMSPDAADACQGVRFPLTLHARGDLA